MTHQLASPALTVTCSPAGAELTSVKDTAGTEYLWQAGAAWQRHAPVLFPIVGKLRNDTFSYKGKEYTMSQHGFARDRVFEISEQQKDRITFTLNADDKTRKNFPFDFLLRIRYTLHNTELITTYEVTNRGKDPMPFSIGAHPGFRCPLLPEEKFTDYFILFEKYSLMQTVLHGGLRGKETRMLPLDEKRLPLTPTLFDEDALVFGNGQVNRVSLISSVTGRGVELISEDWPYFGIWSKKGNREFVCLEPWFGVADSMESTGRLEEKEGIMTLEAGQTFSCSFSVRFF